MTGRDRCPVLYMVKGDAILAKKSRKKASRGASKSRKSSAKAREKATKRSAKQTATKQPLSEGKQKALGVLIMIVALYTAYSYSTATPTLFDRIWGKGIARYLMGNVTVIFCVFFVVCGFMIVINAWKSHRKLMGYIFLLLFNLVIVFSLGMPNMMKFSMIDMFTTPAVGNNAYGGVFGLVLTFILVTIIKKPGTIIVLLALIAFEIYQMIKIIRPDFFAQFKKSGLDSVKGKIDDLKEDVDYAKRRQEAKAERKMEDQDYDNLFNPSDVGEVSVNTQYVNIDDVLNGLDDEDAEAARKEHQEVVEEAKEALAEKEKEDTTFFDDLDDMDDVEDLDDPASQTDISNAAIEPDAVKDSQKKTPESHAALDEAKEATPAVYHVPDVALLSPGVHNHKGRKADVRKKAEQIEQTLKEFKVAAKVVGADVGPSITRFEVQPAPGVKVGKIVNLADDLALRLASSDIRIEAPIPGKSAVGIEVPNAVRDTVAVGEIIGSTAFEHTKAKIPFALGKTLSGQNIIGDISKMPHLLIAGATGSGKSVCINTMIISMIYKLSPEELRFIMIDPKMVELNVYNALPHMLIPVVTDPKKASYALNWGIKEMEDRYKLFKEAGVRDIGGYNKKAESNGAKKLPRIVIIIDELADLMMTSPKEVENAICRIAQLARACGIHLVIATQRPSVDVITGLIKANIPSRIAFAVASNTDSRTILDQVGAEKLLGKGDMLYFPVGKSKPLRVQGTFVSDEEISRVVDAVSGGVQPTFDDHIEEEIARAQTETEEAKPDESLDELFPQAAEIAFQDGEISTSKVQRKLRVGYARAGRIIDELEEKGIISGPNGSKPRKLLISREAYHG